MSQERVNAVGRRKAAVARVYMKAGNGSIVINGRQLAEYFPLELLQFVVKQPLSVTAVEGQYDVKITLNGGGITGQAEAARLGISRCLIQMTPESRGELKKNGFLTRDARVVERKKPGQPGARRRFQFSKR
ncbi:MAG: 30S ribosomal protein S9 [Mucinivorans sp.]